MRPVRDLKTIGASENGDAAMLRRIGSIIQRGFAAFVNFWNIPPLGPEEPEERRRGPLPRL